MSIGWKFPGSNGGTEAGFNDSGIETYAGKPLEHLAREIIQNSLDARVSFDKPVTVVFQVENVLSSDFPGRADILDVMRQCSKENKNEKRAHNFFREAVKILQKPEIVCLKVLDYNTTGLRDGKKGDYKKGQWHRLVKTTGQSAKGSSTAGGSFGIGKNAPFAVSSLRTVFYSTRYSEEDGTLVNKAQGKAILVSHQLDDGDYSRADGFYGVKEGCDKLTGKDIPKLLQRNSREGDGTTLLIPGFNESKKWQEKIIAMVISNYFYAIHMKDLEVLIEGSESTVVIDDQLLPELFVDKKIQNISKDVATAYTYYRAISGSEDNNTEKTIYAKKEGAVPGLEHCILWIMLEEGCEQNIAILRRGMKITDNQKRLRRWGALYANFVAVCICDSNKGNELLRDMENPAHDAFEPGRLGAASKSGEDALDELTKWIREKIEGVAKSNEYKIVPLDRMKEFFQMEDDNLYGEVPERDFEGGSYVVPKPVKIRPRISTTKRRRNIKDQDGNPVKMPAMKIEATRVLAEKNGTEKRIMFTPQETGKGELSLKIAGDSFVENLDIAAVIKGDNAKVVDGKVLLLVVENKRVTLTVRLAQPTDVALLVALGPPTKKASS